MGGGVGVRGRRGPAVVSVPVRLRDVGGGPAGMRRRSRRTGEERGAPPEKEKEGEKKEGQESKTSLFD